MGDYFAVAASKETVVFLRLQETFWASVHVETDVERQL